MIKIFPINSDCNVICYNSSGTLPCGKVWEYSGQTLLAETGEYNDTVISVHRAIQVDPYCAGCWYVSAQILYNDGNKREALHAYRQAAYFAELWSMISISVEINIKKIEKELQSEVYLI